MALLSGCIYVRPKGVMQIIEPCRSYDAKIKLNKKTSYLVGIDQSTSCTGIFLLDKTATFWILIDFKRDDPNKELFFRDLEGFLRELLDGVRVTLVVHEEPIPSTIAPTAHAVLSDLRGRLRSWIARNPAMENAELHSIYPQTWKSRVLDKAELAGRGLKPKSVFNSKFKMATELCRIYPFFDSYRCRRFSTDFDAFDALGILMGYLKYSHNEKGQHKICGTIEKRHKTIVGYAYVDKNSLSFPGTVDEKLGILRYSLIPAVLSFNAEYSVAQNIKMASSNWNFVVTVLPDKYLQPLMWQFDFKEDKGKVMVLFIFKKSYLRMYNSVEAICELFPMHEEV